MASPVLTKESFERSARTSTPSESVAKMTAAGTFRRAGILLGLMVAGAAIGWSLTDPAGPRSIQIPAWSWIALGGAFVTSIVCSFRATSAPLLAPLYAGLEGLFLGAVSRAFEARTDGILLLAIVATAAAFAVTLLLYGFGIVTVDRKFVSIVVSATAGVALLYLLALIGSLFGANLLVGGSSGLGLLLSVAVIVIATLNLFVDYEFIREQVAAGAPRHMEWYAAFGLMLTLVWIYLEMLRLLAEAMGDD